MRSRVYRSTPIQQLDAERLVQGKEHLTAIIGTDVGKHKRFAVCRWSDGGFERPWRVSNPSEIHTSVERLQRMSVGRRLFVAMESSGTYGDALRQGLADGGIEVQRVSGKAAHDFAEIFDGVPSQHDGKDAAVVAELAALGKGSPWPYQALVSWEQELAYWVDWMVHQRQILTMWQGRLEGLLARHWPEATAVLKLSSVTLLKVLQHYGSPQALGADPEAAQQLVRWSRKWLDARNIARLVSEARRSMGVRAGEWEQRRIQDLAQQALQARGQAECGERRLRALARGHAVLEAQGKVVGVPTACVLWVHTGDPRKYYAAAAYRKGMGLNLTERSSGKYQSRLCISKRGSARSRQWLYFAVLRLIQKVGVRRWYEAKKARDPEGVQKVLVALMRKLAPALYHVGVDGQPFDPRRLFARIVPRRNQSARPSVEPSISVES